jgi:hypothetical protein
MHGFPSLARCFRRPRTAARRTAPRLEALEVRDLPSGVPLPQLSSLPGAPANLYLNFTGWYAPSWGAYTNVHTPAFDLDGDPSSFSPYEASAISEIWQRVSEIYSPFNINVTTVAPADLSHGHTQVVVVGGSSNDWFHQAAGGVSYTGGFSNPALPNVSYVFPDQLAYTSQYIAVAAAHEAGHGFGLEHQSVLDAAGRLVEEYNPGDANAAPIMSDAYNAARARWWLGTTDTGAIQNDMAVIAGPSNGFGYRPAPYGHGLAAATPLSGANGRLGAAGVLDTPASADWFSFTTVGGPASLQVTTAAVGAMLDPRLELWSAGGQLLAVADQPGAFSAALSLTLAPGTYYVAVRSHGDYGDDGQYGLAVQVAQGPPTVFTDLSAGRAADGGMEVFAVGADGQVWARAIDASGAWGAWRPTAAGQVRSVRVGADAAGRPEVFVIGLDDQVYTATSDAAGNWSGYRATTAGQVRSLSAGRDAAGRPELFVVGLDGQVYAATSDSSGD